MADDVNLPSVAISASTTSASAAIPVSEQCTRIRVVNPTTALCYVKTGIGAATATNANQAVGVYSERVFEKPQGHNTVAVLLSTGTGTIAVSPSYS